MHSESVKKKKKRILKNIRRVAARVPTPFYNTINPMLANEYTEKKKNGKKNDNNYSYRFLYTHTYEN